MDDVDGVTNVLKWREKNPTKQEWVFATDCLD